jgi:tetratricopeptide (TPR) repeat protein
VQKLVHSSGETLLRKLAVLWLLLIPVAVFAASGDEFYQRLYQRGMAHFAAGDYAHAFTELRNAAFGFVEQVDQFESAQAYAIIAAHRLGHDSDARDSLLRIVAAEKVQPHFRSVTLPDAVRAEVDAVAAALLTAEECTLLGVPEQLQQAAAAAKPPVVVPTPTKRPNVAVTAPREKESTDETATPDDKPKATPQPVVPAPQPPPVTPQPVVPAPRPVVPTPQPVDPAPQPRPPIQQPPAPPKPETIRPQPQPVTPDPTPQPATPKQPVKDADASFAEAQRAIDNGEIGRARSVYKALLSGSPLSHPAALRLAEGLSRVGDFPDAALAFKRAGTLGHGEERYHYDYAVALYETGRYAEAKRELALSLPYVAATADVARYRAKIEGAIE